MDSKDLTSFQLVSHTFSHLNFTTTLQNIIVIILSFILQRRNLRDKGIQHLAQGHAAGVELAHDGYAPIISHH